MLTHKAAKAFYDRFGATQDAQVFYEHAALADLVAHAGFEDAAHVCEFGCGTGRFARQLLEDQLSPDARYVGVDLSSTMVRLATAHLASFGDRARIHAVDGTPACPVPDGAVDRVVSTYVLDLLTDADITAFVHGSARALSVHGRLCLVSLTFGEGVGSRLVTAGWRLLFRLSARLVGGCRPLRLASYVEGAPFRIVHHAKVSSYAVASEVLVAERTLLRNNTLTPATVEVS